MDEIARLLAMVEDSKGKPMKDVPKEILDKLAALEQQADLLQKVNESLFESAGVKKEQIRKQKIQQDVTSETLEALDRLQEMRKEVAVLQGEAAAAHIIAKRREKSDKRGQVKRMKKFRRIDDKWKPM